MIILQDPYAKTYRNKGIMIPVMWPAPPETRSECSDIFKNWRFKSDQYDLVKRVLRDLPPFIPSRPDRDPEQHKKLLKALGLNKKRRKHVR